MEPDWKGALLAAAVLTLVAILFLPAVGGLASWIESLQARLLSRIGGDKLAMFVSNRLTIMGVVVHELAHAGLALLTGAKILEISFWDTGGDSLGHVSYQNRGPKFLHGIQDAFTACAPTVAGLLSAYLIYRGFSLPDLKWWEVLLLVYAALCTLDHMSMSKPDFRCYFRGIYAPAMIIYGVLFLLFIVI